MATGRRVKAGDGLGILQKTDVLPNAASDKCRQMYKGGMIPIPENNFMVVRMINNQLCVPLGHQYCIPQFRCRDMKVAAYEQFRSIRL